MNAKLTGNRIKAAREAKGISKGISQEELGGRLGPYRSQNLDKIGFILYHAIGR